MPSIDMPTFVHITSEDIAKKAKRGGVRPAKNGQMKQWRSGAMVGVYFRIPDSELVWVGRYRANSCASPRQP